MKICFIDMLFNKTENRNPFKLTSHLICELTQTVLKYMPNFLNIDDLDDLDDLNNFNLIVIHYYKYENSNKLSETIINKLKNYVNEGGSLFVTISKNNADSVNKLIKYFNVKYYSNSLLKNDERKSWILSPRFNIQNLNTNLPFSEIALDDSGYMISDEKPFLLSYEKKGIAYLESYGRGKIGILSDTEILSQSYIGASNNYQLGLFFISELLGKTLTKVQKQEAEVLLCKPLTITRTNRKSETTTIDCIDYRQQISHLVNKISFHPYKEREDFIFQSSLLFDDFPKEIREHVRRFKNYGNKHGFFLIKGLENDKDLIRTPSCSEKFPQKKSFKSEFYLSAIGSSLGDVFTFAQEKGGNFFQNILPTFNNATNVSSESSNIFLDFHTEIAFHPVNTDYLILYCLRSDHKKIAKTLIFSIHSILEFIPPRYFNILFEKVFQTGIDFSFGSQNGKKANGPKLAILTGDRYNPYLKCDFDLMIGLTNLADEALSYIKREALKFCQEISLEPGDLLIVDNNCAMHGRTHFRAHYDGYDRWLQRILVSRDLIPSKRYISIEDRTVSLQFAT